VSFLTWSVSFLMSFPFIMTVPLVALIIPLYLKQDYLHVLRVHDIYYVPVKIDIVVVFPAPLWPSNTVISFS
jgi:hypothetical protein